MIHADNELFVGLDMGGTDIKATVSNAGGEILIDDCEKVLSFAADGPRSTVEQIALAATKIVARAGVAWERVSCAGLCTPGPATVDGQLGRSPNLNHAEWEGFAIGKAVSERIGRPVVYANDGNAAGYWEYHRIFKDDPTKILAAITLGTGLGGAMVWGGNLLAGAHGCGGEFGHIRLPTHLLVDGGDVPVCGCGKSACAEAFASVTALDHFLRKALARPENAGHPLNQIPDTGKTRALKLLRLAQDGDALALSLFDRQADAVGLLLVQLSNCFDPDVFVIGGGLTESSESFRMRYLARVRAVFAAETFPIVAAGALIDFAGDQDLAGCRGAALVARQFMQKTRVRVG
jgi:glucokinase